MNTTNKTEKPVETRALQNAIREISQSEGIVDAYLTAWDTIDSYRTTFQRGCFKKTFENRANKIKVLWNHDTLAGKCLEAREDDYGAFVRVQLNLATETGRTAFEHIKAGDVDSFSFGFNVIQDKWIEGIRTFTEVKVLECSPVLFPANEMAVIVDVREQEKRDTSFFDTVNGRELSNRGHNLFCALEYTIDDIRWNENTSFDTKMEQADKAISNFHTAYMEWLTELRNNNMNFRDITKEYKNELQQAVRKTINENIIKETSLTIYDFKRLDEGLLLPFESRKKLVELPESVQVAHQQHRNKAVETLCNELREGGFTAAEKTRFISLLNIDDEQQPEQSDDELDKAITFIKQLKNNLRL